MRTLPALAAMALLTVAGAASTEAQRAARPAPARDWGASVTPTPQGGMLLGNPAAATKVVEYGSYTCPHCGQFAAESKPALGPRLRSGAVSLEYRHLIRDAMDLAAVVVARCGGPQRFARLHDAIFAGQQTWLARGASFAQTNAATLRQAETTARLRGLAEGAGLLAIGRAQGLSDAQLSRCFADKAALDRLVAAGRDVPPEVTGTPAFFVNGRYASVHDWAGLQPLLAAR